MDSLNKKQKAHVAEAAANLLHESKQYAHELYEEGLNKVNEAENNVKKHSDQLLKKVEENPLTSVLIAGGIGFLLAKLMKK
ncbi:hypothetical protein [Legionella fallonii]|uniref:DUF883 domain-containing protein n=1 Tax=Legionella fallonii LLAP-10 TaxID=1212491 RepID=A0A098G4T3_9GAMM|nr:hypothetical protein [Legionella fallonii]CEG56976.1 conserved protein of unknown function [Legionella fallonii LLAP-10]